MVKEESKIAGRRFNFELLKSTLIKEVICMCRHPSKWFELLKLFFKQCATKLIEWIFNML